MGYMLLHAFFQGIFKNIVFRSTSLGFFSQIGLSFRPVSYPINKKNIFLNKKSFKLLFIKVTKFHGDSVKNESARTK